MKMQTTTNMDALANVLKTIRLSADTYFCTDFAAPWGMDIEKKTQGMFHILVKGSCWLKEAKEQQPIQLSAGDIVAFPTGGAHWLSDSPHSPKRSEIHVLEQILDGANPFQPMNEATGNATILCGTFSYDSSLDHPFVKDLPCFIRLNASESPELNWLSPLITLLSTESRQPSPGSTVMVDRLTEVLFIQLIRAHMNRSLEKSGYIAALADKHIGAALNRIHADNQARWTVGSLSEAVALSRTAFTGKFTKMVGMSPKAYLVNWRMQIAKNQLESSDMTMIDIAESAGYSSEAAFSKAFKQQFALPPGQVRRNRSS